MFADTDWLPLLIRRDRNIIDSLHDVIHQAAFEKEVLKGRSVREQVHSLYLDYYKPIYLIFDQFEELFILGNREEANRFFWMLAELLKAKLQVKIILIMREEYLANLDNYERIVPGLFTNRFRIERMRTEDLTEVIQRSAERFEIEIEEPKESVSKAILDNIRNEKGYVDLANLQVYLDHLYRDGQKRSPNKAVRFDRSLVQRTGALGDVLARFLDEQLDRIDIEMSQRGAKGEQTALRVLAELVTNQATKQPQLVGNIMDRLIKEENIRAKDVEYCIQRLAELRIIRYLEKT